MTILPTAQRLRLLLMTSILLFAPPAIALDSAQWQADLDFIVEKLSTRHANPWGLVHKQAFDTRAKQLGARMHQMSDQEITLEMMRLVATLQDGHTKLLPTGPRGFKTWYPLRMNRFSDGVYLTSMPRDMTELRGLRINSINGRDALEVMEQVTSVFGADNRFGRQAFAYLASNADLLQVLGVVGEDRMLELVFEDDSGRNVRRFFEPVVENESMDFRFWGEMFGPEEDDSASAWGGPSIEFLTTANPDRPLHLRQRNAYYWEYLEDQETVYFQLNYMTRQSSQSEFDIMQTWEQALTASRNGDRPAQRFIIDLRYNFGGDGSITKSLISRFLRGYPRALEPGRVFVITSGATFSAGVMMAEELRDHIPVVLVGEPMGAPWNHYGDAESFTLPNSGFQLDVSRRYWQLAESDDNRRFIPVRLPASMSGKDYFSGADPATDQIFAAPAPYPTLDRVLIEQGPNVVEQTYRERMEDWGSLDYWLPVGRTDLEVAADELIAAGRLDDAMIAYQINTRVFPDDWDTWDDLGDVCLTADLDDCVLDSYSRALELNPSNWNSGDQKAAIREITGSR